MKPILLTLCGWGPYREKETVDFRLFEGRGLFLVTGATGAGKTTIFDAIAYALYGNVSGNMREKDSVRSDFASPETATYVHLIMTHKGEEYSILRNPKYLRPKKRKSGNAGYTEEKEDAKLILPDGKIIQGSNDVTKKIQEILVLDFAQFKQISMIAQGEFVKLLTASPKEKIQIFRDIFGTGIYDRFANILRKKSSALYNEIMEFKHKMEESISNLSIEEEEWEILTCTESHDYAKIVSYLNILEQTMISQEEFVNNNIIKTEHSISTITKTIANRKRDSEVLEQLKSSKEKLASLELQGESYEKKKGELSASKRAQAVEVAELNYKNLKNDIIKSQTKMEDLKVEFKDLKIELTQLRPFFLGKETVERYVTQINDYIKSMDQLELSKQLLTVKQRELHKLQEQYLVVEEESKEKKQEYEMADRLYKRATVGIVIQMLRDGEPCPVCGSVEHPHVKKVLEEIPNEEQLQKLKGRYEEAEKRRLDLFGKTSIWKGDTDREKEMNSLAKKVVVDNKDLLLQAVSQTTNEEMDLFYLLIERKLEECIFLEKENLQTIVKKVSLELQKKIERYLNINGLIVEKEDAIRKLDIDIVQGKKKEKEKQSEFIELLIKYEFSNEEDYQASKRRFEVIINLEKDVQNYNQAVCSLKDLIAKNQENVKNIVEVDFEPLQLEMDGFLHQKKVLQEQQKQFHVHISQIKIARDSIISKLGKMNDRLDEYGIVKDLDHLTSGNNTKRLVFEQYVLASYFEDILLAANLRFTKMTAMRYELSRVEGVIDGRSKDNLEIQVLDNYTGKYRLVKTLSGGELFKASLALALGLSDVIQSSSGGIRVEALFIDEGFGSLDAESLDQACETLNSLVDKERMIGIISHVGELRERIDNKIVVNKTSIGSFIQVNG